MAVYIVTGKLRSGKTLATVGKMRDYLNQGRKVATNIDLNLHRLINPWAKKSIVYRIPDKPTFEQLYNLPSGNDGPYNEEKFGALVLDEAAIWLNSRDYRDKSRAGFIDWLVHSGKQQWDIYLIIQDVNALDSQVREMFGEHVVYCRRSDRFNPSLLRIFNSFSPIEIKLPKIHLGIVKYGTQPSSITVDKWHYRGKDLYKAYNTQQAISRQSIESDNGLYQVLPPYYTFGYKFSKKFINKLRGKYVFKKVRQTRIHFFLLGALAVYFLNPSAATSNTDELNQLQSQLEQLKKEINKKDNSENKQSESQTESDKTQKKIYITGVVVQRTTFTYSFESDGSIYYPQYEGYTVRYISDCKAQLIKGDKIKTVFCNPYSTYPDPTPTDKPVDIAAN